MEATIESSCYYYSSGASNLDHACVGLGSRMLQFRNCSALANRKIALAMKPKRLHEHWRAALKDRVAAIRQLLHKHHPLSAKEVHDLRVALRRARLLASLGCHSIGKSKAKSFRDCGRVLLDLVSPIRDCDVASDWLSKTKCPAKVVATLQSRRGRLWHAAKPRIRSSRSKLAIDLKSKHHANKLQRRLEKKMTDAASRCLAMAKDHRKFTPTDLHAFRRIVRRWRYLRELLLPPNRQNRDGRLRFLLKLQDSLGASQNSEAILNQLKPLGRTKELNYIRSKLKNSYKHSRREALHQIKSLPVTA